jgi:hypothetical protein
MNQHRVIPTSPYYVSVDAEMHLSGLHLWPVPPRIARGAITSVQTIASFRCREYIVLVQLATSHFFRFVQVMNYDDPNYNVGLLVFTIQVEQPQINLTANKKCWQDLCCATNPSLCKAKARCCLFGGEI